MNNYAVVVGIDQYKNPGWQLTSAVKDALRFASWAIRFGGVLPVNLKLLLSPAGEAIASAAIPETNLSVPVTEATSQRINEVLFDDFQERKCGMGGDRLYFYYAGHGCSHPAVRGDRNTEDPVLICSNIEKLPKQYAELISFSNILDPLLGCEPRDQFFFLDACRDFALDGITGSTPGGGRFTPRKPEDGVERSRQWMIYATSPGERAIETRGKGVFGEALLRGLRGDSAAPRRVAGAGTYELRFTDLFEFVQASVKEKVGLIPGAARSTQTPEFVSDRRTPDPLVVAFTEEQIAEVPLLVRVSPDEALKTATLNVWYESSRRWGPFGPGLSIAQTVNLKPAHYSLEAEACDYQKKRTDPFRHPAGKPVELELLPAPAGAAPAAPSSQFIGFSSRDPMVMIGVTGPGGYRAGGTGAIYIQNALPGLYHVRAYTPEGTSEEYAFEFPQRSGFIELTPPTPQIVPSQMTMLGAAGITPSAEGYMEPSETLGPMANIKPASLLGFAAYAAYTMDPRTGGSRLRSFGLEPIPLERRGEAWICVLLNVETGAPGFHAASSVAVYSTDYQLGRLTTLERFPAAAQYLMNTTEGNVVVELRLPEMQPTRFPLTCFQGRVATLCVNITLSGEMEVQIYLVPFDWNQMTGDTIRVVEQAQRFYSGTEAVPATMIDSFLQLKALDPLLGCVAGYELVRQNRAGEYKGFPNPNLPAGEWNLASAMQNMLAHFGLLPDAHVLAALCDPENRDRHFQQAAKTGIPLFTEGFRILIDHFRQTPGLMDVGMWHAQRTLAAGSPFSAWLGFEPALEIESGRFEKPPAAWWMLEEHRARIEREVRAVGAVLVEAPDYHSHRTGFLVAKDLVLTVNHLFTSVLTPGDQSPALRPGTQVRFVTADRLDEAGANGTSATLIAIDREVRGGLALLRLENQVADVDPLPISPLEQEVRRDGRLYLIGYPFMQTNLDTELVRHVFGDNLGVKRLQPGYLVAAPADKPGFDHDAFTLEGSAGSPVIDLETGRVLGLHWGGMNQSNFRRGRATCLWKPQNRGILRAAGVVSDPQGAA
jgi:hypothetical protein